MGVLVGKKAPDFRAKAVVENRIIEEFSLSQFRGQYVLLFFYPLDFTFVCPTEIHAFQENLVQFKRRNTVIMGCSVDSAQAHFTWLSIPRNKGGIQGVQFPLISDINKTISKDYDVLCEEEGISFRGLFLIDREGYVRHQIVNDLPLGRSVDEAIRMIDAWTQYEIHGDVCPANWQQGRETLKPNLESLEKYFAAVPSKIIN